jgi:hypothetical protein
MVVRGPNGADGRQRWRLISRLPEVNNWEKMHEPKCLVKVLAAYQWMDSRMGQGEWRSMVAGSVYRGWGRNEDCETI